MIRRLTALTVALASCFSLAACSGSSNNGSAKVDGFTIPAAATKDNLAGEKAFLHYWVNTVNQATTSGNTKKMKALSDKSCSVCADFAHTLDKIYGAGGHVNTKGWSITAIVPIAKTPKNNPGLQMDLKVAAQNVYPSKGAKAQPHPGGNLGWQVYLIRRGDHWLMDKVNV